MEAKNLIDLIVYSLRKLPSSCRMKTRSISSMPTQTAVPLEVVLPVGLAPRGSKWATRWRRLRSTINGGSPAFAPDALWRQSAPATSPRTCL